MEYFLTPYSTCVNNREAVSSIKKTPKIINSGGANDKYDIYQLTNPLNQTIHNNNNNTSNQGYGRQVSGETHIRQGTINNNSAIAVTEPGTNETTIIDNNNRAAKAVAQYQDQKKIANRFDAAKSDQSYLVWKPIWTSIIVILLLYCCYVKFKKYKPRTKSNSSPNDNDEDDD